MRDLIHRFAMDFPRMSARIDGGDRHVLPEYLKRCPVAIEIGMERLSHLEVQEHQGRYWYTYWNKRGEVVQSRMLSAEEVDYLPHAEKHVAEYFSSIMRGLDLSDRAFGRTSGDALVLIAALDRVIKRHDAALLVLRRAIPGAPEDPHISALRWLAARLWDFVEMAEVGLALSDETRQLLPGE